MAPFFGRLFLFAILCWLRRCVAGEADVDCAEVTPGAGAGLLQSKTRKSHADLGRLQGAGGDQDQGAEWLQQDLGEDETLKKNQLAPKCQKRAQPPPVPVAVAEQLEKEHSARQAQAQGAQGAQVEECPGQLPLVRVARDRRETTCCPLGSMECSGCAFYRDGSCEVCRGGFVRQNGSCVACLSTPGWVNENGATCDAVGGTGCNDRPVAGTSSNQACCRCGGGHKSPTPFQYEDRRFAVGSPVELRPLPRTASRYSVDPSCNLAAFNLTLDGATGAISYEASKKPPAKAFSVQCEVTAHQGHGLSETVKVAVAVDFMTYASSSLVFSQDVASYPVRTASGTWRDFSMTCAPESPWLSLDRATGALASSSGGASGIAGAVTESGDGEYVGMDGAVCVVSAWQLPGPGAGANASEEMRSSTVVALKPRPWPQLEYEAAFAQVVVGEELPPLKRKVPAGYEAGSGGLKPTAFDISCSVGSVGALGSEGPSQWTSNHSMPAFDFQTLWGVGLLGTHQLLEVAPDGSIVIAPGASLAKMFDEMLADALHRKSITLHCGVWGTFPGTQFQPLLAPMVIKIKDSMCWISESFSGEVVHEETQPTESGCRNACRFSKVCSHFTYNYSQPSGNQSNQSNQSQDLSHSCKFYRVNDEAGSPVTAYAKITECKDLSSCLRLKHPQWLVAGDFCPVAYDYRRGGPVYRKESSIPEEVMYLAKVPVGSASSCPVGHWLVQSAALDYVDEKMGYFELRGAERLCLDPGLPAVGVAGNGAIRLDWATMPCAKPHFDEVEDEQIHPLVFDDPTTSQPDDFWLHPCDCVPHGWGLGFPANPLVVEAIPSGSDGIFIPPPTLIVSGQFACPSRQLLPGQKGIYFSSEAESFESAVCQERCKDFAKCRFFWTGTSHGAETCRLYSGCDALVREFGMEGDLMALPHSKSCMVANPETCWKTTLRRQFLTQKASASSVTPPPAVKQKSGGTRSFTSLRSKRLDRSKIFTTKLGDASMKLVGFTEIKKRYGYIRGLGGFASITVEALNPNQEYRWSLFGRSNAPNVTHGIAVNHRKQTALVQPTQSSVKQLATGIVPTTPRGQIILDLEAKEYELSPTEIEGEYGENSVVRCPAGHTLTSCACKAYRGMCSGTNMMNMIDHWACWAYGTMEGQHGEIDGVPMPMITDSKVRARARCLKLQFVSGYEVQRSTRAARFLQMGPGILKAANSSDIETESEEKHDELLSQMDTEPETVTASCGAKRLLSCGCYPDFNNVNLLKRTMFFIFPLKPYCKAVWRSENSCKAQGGYAYAICAHVDSPGVEAWEEVQARGQYWTDEDEGPVAQCPPSKVLVGCWCSSETHKDCRQVVAKGDRCIARPNMFYSSLERQFVNLTRVHAKLQASAWCAFIQQSALIISKIEVARVGGSSLLQEAEQSSFSGRGRRQPRSYAYLHLYQQCDALLLMGGVGVQHCNRPSFRKPFSHKWRGKRPLPVSFAHGRQLDVGCWQERYQKFRKGGSQRGGETMHCVNGEWFNGLQLPEMTGFSCKPCVAVASLGYGKYMEKQQQELYFFNRMGLRVFTELSPWGGAALKYCLQMAFDGGERKNIRLNASHTCPEIVTMGVVGSGDVQERMMRVLKDGQPFEDSCLQAQPGQDDLSPSLQRQTCDLDQEQQLISPMAMPEILWSMHQEEDKRSNSLHKARSSFCGGHGALSSLSFGQIFGGMTSVPKSTCAFAPVIRFGQLRDTQITMDPRSNFWPEWNTLMANSPVLCEDGHALTSFHLAVARGFFVYECSQIAGLGATYEYFSAQVEVKGGFNENRYSWSQAMRLLRADCGKSALLSGFHFEFSEGGRWARSKFTCAKAGGAPVVMEPATTVEDLYQAPEGIFCPHQSDFDTGRFQYKNKETGDTLNFEQDGSWCVGSDCSVPVGGATPVGVAMSTFEVVNVTDFDGHFEAKGVPSLGGGGMGDLMKSLKAIKPPKRPEQPPKPKLQDFKAEMPKYASECLDYQDLWTGVMETGQNSEGEEASEVAPLEADAGTLDAELPAYHPCDVMKNVGGIFGRLAGQSGKMAPANMLYNDWNECMTGDIERDFLAGKLDYGNALYHSIADVITEGVKLVCAIPPNVEVAPLGAGVEAAPSSICAEVTDFVRSIVNLPFDLGKGAMDLALETEGYAACNPFQVGFPRLFCDIHCVRDAVVRGDRTILRNLEKATKISNDNMRKMVEWSTEAARVESGYLDKKIDHSLKINTIYLHHIAKNTQPNGEELFQDAAHSTLAMLGELEGFAGASSFGVSRVTAVDALDRFVAAAQPLSAENTTERLGQVEMFQSQLSSLHQSMRTAAGGMTKAQVIGRQVAREAQQMQAHMRRQEQVLGIYRAHSHASHKAYKTWERSGAEATLVSLDALWWRLRGKLDSYLDAAGSEIETFKQSFKALAEYENCKAGTVDLLKSYRRSMRSMGKSHQHLRTAWRDASNLMGELASVISDGDVFGKFIAAEGCSSPLAAQTLDQTRLALQGTGFLLHRFQVAGLGKPDAGVLQEAAKRIHQAYASASSSCGAKGARASGPLTHWAAAFRKSLSELFSRTST